MAPSKSLTSQVKDGATCKARKATFWLTSWMARCRAGRFVFTRSPANVPPVILLLDNGQTMVLHRRLLSEMAGCSVQLADGA